MTTKTAASPATLTNSPPPSQTSGLTDDVSRALRDRVLGAIWALGRGPGGFATLEDVRERLDEVTRTDFDRTVSALDRGDEIVLDGGGDSPRVKLAPTIAFTGDVPRPLQDRLLGAIWVLARGSSRPVSLAALSERLSDLERSPLERALVALAVDGELHLGKGPSASFVRLAIPTPMGRFTETFLRSVKDRVVGAISVLARGPGRGAPHAGVGQSGQRRTDGSA